MFPRRIYATICVYFFIICYTDIGFNVSRTTHDNMLQHIGENIANRISSGFREVSSHMDSLFVNSESKPVVIPSTSIPSSSSNDPAGRLGHPQKIIYTGQPLPQLVREDYPQVKQWFVDEYNGRRRAGKETEEDADQADGPKDPILSSYMEDQHGRPIHSHIRNNVRAVAKNVFWTFLRNGRAPARWRDACLDVSNELVYQLETNFEWLRYCQGHWKAIKIATNSYPQWYEKAKARYDKTKASKGMTSDTEVIDVDADKNTQKAPLKRRLAEDDSTPPPKRPHLEEDPSCAQPAKSTANRRRVRIIYKSYHYLHH